MKEIKGFKNSFILTEDGIKKTGLIIENGLIKEIGNFDDEQLIELEEDKIIIPGLIDQHIHGASGVDAIDGTKEAIYKMACSLAQEGVTAFLATTTTQSVEVIDKSLQATKEYIEDNIQEGAQVLGIHLEGPYIAKKCMGAQLPNYIIKPDIDSFKHFEEVSGNNIKLVSIAPEEGPMEFIDYLKSKNIVASIGHSASKYEEVKEAIKHGASCVTHTYNGMERLHRSEVGVLGASFLFDELYCEVICDGIHICIPGIQLLFKNKAKDKIILITDALRTKYMPDGKYYELEQVIVLKGKEARLEDGTLAGSVLKMNEAIKNVMDFVGTDFETTVKFATENPAKNLGIFNTMGSIIEGKVANFAIVDKDMNVYKTIREGKVIYDRL